MANSPQVLQLMSDLNNLDRPRPFVSRQLTWLPVRFGPSIWTVDWVIWPKDYDIPNAHLLFVLGRNTVTSASGQLSFFGNLSNFQDKSSLLFDYLPLLTQPLLQANSTLYWITYLPACKSFSIHLHSRSNHLNINNVSLPISYILYSVTMAAHPFQYWSTLHPVLCLHGVMQIFIKTSALEVEASNTIDNMSHP